MGKIAIIGPGRLGTAIGVLLKEKGYCITGVAGSNSESVHRAASRLGVEGTTKAWELTPQAQVVFITTPDRVIGEVSELIFEKGGFKAGQVVIHTSGALPANVLTGAQKAGAKVLSLHPLQSFADLEGALQNLPGSYFSLEGDPEAYAIGQEITESLGGKYFFLKSELKPLYHMGAVIASNYLVSVLHWAIRTYGQLGMDEKEAAKALLPLIEGSLNNVSALGPEKALTGPISRGDITTVHKHLAALEEFQPGNGHLYRVLGAYTAGIARNRKSISEEAFDQMIKIFEGGFKDER